MRECSPPTMCHISHVKCHVSDVTCHSFFLLLFFGQSGGASRWRVCYQRGLPSQFFSPKVDKKNHSYVPPTQKECYPFWSINAIRVDTMRTRPGNLVMPVPNSNLPIPISISINFNPYSIISIHFH